jgi:hypothetical protein
MAEQKIVYASNIVVVLTLGSGLLLDSESDPRCSEVFGECRPESVLIPACPFFTPNASRHLR